MSDRSSKVPFLPDNISCTIKLTFDPARDDTNEKSMTLARSGGSIEKFSSVAQAFVTYLQVLWQYAHEIGSVAERTSLTNLAQLPELLRDIKKRQQNAISNEVPVATIEFEAKSKRESTMPTMVIPVFELEHVVKLNDCLIQHNKALRLLNETVLQQMVNAWERALGELVAWKLNADPDALPKNKMISLADIMSISNFDDVRRRVVEDEVGDFLKSKTISEQINYFKSEFRADLQSHFPAINELCEIVLRRHAVVHAGGIASSEYCRRVRKLKNLPTNPPEQGTLLPLDSVYIRRSWSVIFSAGVILTHLVARTHAQDKKCKEDEETADTFLINAAFNAIKSKQYKAAITVLQYAHKLRLAHSGLDMMVLINLAQSYKWSGDNIKCQSLLDEGEWKSCSANFRVCVAALREDYDSFQKELCIAASEGSVGLAQLYEWPIFQKVRSRKDLPLLLKVAYGEDIVIPAQGKPTKLLNFESESTMSELLKGIVGEIVEFPGLAVEHDDDTTTESN